MQHHHPEIKESDYGTGKKQLSIYLVGLIACIILTVIAFGTVMTNIFSKWQTFAIIYSAAFVQFVVQLICFLRLNTQTEQGKNNVMSFIFTLVILMSVIIGSLWIMWNVHYNYMF